MLSLLTKNLLASIVASLLSFFTSIMVIVSHELTREVILKITNDFPPNSSLELLLLIPTFLLLLLSIVTFIVPIAINLDTYFKNLKEKSKSTASGSQHYVAQENIKQNAVKYVYKSPDSKTNMDGTQQKYWYYNDDIIKQDYKLSNIFFILATISATLLILLFFMPIFIVKGVSFSIIGLSLSYEGVSENIIVSIVLLLITIGLYLFAIFTKEITIGAVGTIVAFFATISVIASYKVSEEIIANITDNIVLDSVGINLYVICGLIFVFTSMLSFILPVVIIIGTHTHYEQNKLRA